MPHMRTRVPEYTVEDLRISKGWHHVNRSFNAGGGGLVLHAGLCSAAMHGQALPIAGS